MTTVVVWVAFTTVILTCIAIDLFAFHKTPQRVSPASATRLCLFWMSLAAVFNVYIYFLYENNWMGWGVSSILDLSGREASIQFLTGYLIELSLSVDNVFVIMMIFTLMKVPESLQYRVLFWGIVGAILMRGTLIGTSAVLIQNLSWMSYVFGLILIVSAARMLAISSEHSAGDILAVRLARRLIPVTENFQGERFLIRNPTGGKWIATPLFLTLVMVEWADLVFAVDSIPAVFAVTTDPFIVFTSNVFAILGLRSMYFLVSHWVAGLRFLKFSLIFILTFVGAKMMLSHHIEIPSWVTLVVAGSAILVGVGASLFAADFERRAQRRQKSGRL